MDQGFYLISEMKKHLDCSRAWVSFLRRKRDLLAYLGLKCLSREPSSFPPSPCAFKVGGRALASINAYQVPGMDIWVHAQSYSHVLTLWDPIDCSAPGFSVHGIFQTRILEWVAISFSRASSNPGIQPVSLAFPASIGEFFTTVSPGKPSRHGC